MKTPPRNHTHLWNNLSHEERTRLMPCSIESQLMTIWQCKHKAIEAHKKHMATLDSWALNIEKELRRIEREQDI